jgi:hypothetical protein
MLALALPAPLLLCCDKDKSSARSSSHRRSQTGTRLVKVTVRAAPEAPAARRAAGAGKAGTGAAGAGKAGAGKAETAKVGAGKAGTGKAGTAKAGAGKVEAGDAAEKSEGPGGEPVATLRLALRSSWPERHRPIGDPGARGDGILLTFPRARALGVSLRTASRPADVVLLGSSREVVRVVARVAASTARRVDVIPRLFQYVLVLPAGSAARYHLRPGATASFTLPRGARPRDVLTEVSLSPPGASAVRVRVELAMTPAETAFGLMYRRSLPRRGGMLFRFPRPRVLWFYMKNTHIPLDMIFINDARRVTGVIHRARPLDERMMGVGPVKNRYVLEVRAGFARRHRITAGTRVHFRLPD